ncbi:MAG: sulfotransferase [Gemmataceae bacterium]|nr:sulfotransferase [Gemmataceae bacterium]
MPPEGIGLDTLLTRQQTPQSSSRPLISLGDPRRSDRQNGSVVQMSRQGKSDGAAPAVRRRRWSPRFFEGTDIFTWLRYLVRVRGRIDPPYWYIAAIITVSSTVNLMMRYLRHGGHGDRIRQTSIVHPPLFVVGHWRTGTTLLHELLACDPRFAYPDFFACFNPNQVLLTEGFFKNYAHFLAPEQRPMDNMVVGWEKPQEDEFALCLLGLPSSYADLAFPQAAPLAPGAIDLSGLSPRQLQQWKRGFYRYLQLLSYRDPRPLVLKSPPHMARVPVLLELFPQARFVHIVRDPRVVIPSTVRMLQSMTRSHCLQRPGWDNLWSRVFDHFDLLYRRWAQARPLLRPEQVHELRYEDLVRDPLGELRRLYDALALPGYEQALPYFQRYLQQTDGYETNRYTLTPEQLSEIERRCATVIQQYGY